MIDVGKVATEICKSRSGLGIACCQWPSNMGKKCCYKGGAVAAFGDGARAAALEVLRQLEEPSEEMLAEMWDATNRDGWGEVIFVLCEIWQRVLCTARAALERTAGT